MAKTFHFKSSYLNDQGYVVKTKYTDGTTAIQLVSVFSEPLATASVNLSEYGKAPCDGNIFVPTYSQYEGIYDCLYELGIVGEVIREVPVGPHGASAIECKLLLSDEDMRVIENG